MSQSVFIKAWLRTTKGDLDISDSIESIRHESDKEKGVLVDFKVKTDKGLDIANHNDMVAGAVIVYTFGFLKSFNQSPVKLCRVGDIRYDLSQKRVQLLIQAVDKSLEIKKTKSYRVWKNKTLSEMCEEIATDYGLTFRYETTTVTKYTSMPQAGRSDWGFCSMLDS